MAVVTEKKSVFPVDKESINVPVSVKLLTVD